MLKRVFLAGMALALLSFGVTSCADEDETTSVNVDNNNSITNTYEYSSLYGKTFAYTGTTQSGSSMTQYITVTDSENVTWKMVSSYTHAFDFTSCSVENTAADEYTVTGSYTFNGNASSVSMVFNIKASDEFDWTYSGKTYEGFTLYSAEYDVTAELSCFV
ncbi:hypothetical protein, partial [Treponema sp.]|uniref:hypothetical protein n=1 Tax=Treponema sp. TaxID=166 RepID=UPI0038909C21